MELGRLHRDRQARLRCPTGARLDPNTSRDDTEPTLIDEDEDDDGSDEEKDEYVDAEEHEVQDSTDTHPDVEKDCGICFDSVRIDESWSCEGEPSHTFCFTCGRAYIRGGAELGGDLEGTRTQPPRDAGSDPITSAPGQLPCPNFVNGCECANIPQNTIFRILSNDPEVSRLFMASYRRVVYRQEFQELEQRQQQRQEPQQQPQQHGPGLAPLNNAQNGPTPLQIFHRVTEALSAGYTINCPGCGAPGHKDNQCMHIHCDSCGNDWCYCCGRYRFESGPLAERCRGCDRGGLYLQNHNGWGDCAILDEDPGTGALWEFHRRVQAYYVRRVKEGVPEQFWLPFQEEYPNILSNTPTFGKAYPLARFGLGDSTRLRTKHGSRFTLEDRCDAGTRHGKST